MTPAPRLRFRVRPESYVMCRLDDPAAAVQVPRGDVLTWLLKDGHGWSAVLPEAALPPGVEHEGPWRALSLKGPFPFTQTGVLSSVLAPLADADVPILAVSGFDTDHVLVPGHLVVDAVRALERAGHEADANPGSDPSQAR